MRTTVREAIQADATDRAVTVGRLGLDSPTSVTGSFYIGQRRPEFATQIASAM